MDYFIILLGGLLRVIPHPANFAPIGALALFGGARLRKSQAILLPLLAMAVSDIFIGFDSLPSRLSVYLSFIVIALIGMALRRSRSVVKIMAGSLAGSVVFYLVTNFVFFHSSGLYPHTVAGLVSSYINAIPFFRNTILSDLAYSGVFFGAYELVRVWQKKPVGEPVAIDD
ncbi:MAG: DUF6580 family putative transport protein [Candidatus Saccharibacteria bacterium]